MQLECAERFSGIGYKPGSPEKLKFCCEQALQVPAKPEKALCSVHEAIKIRIYLKYDIEKSKICIESPESIG